MRRRSFIRSLAGLALAGVSFGRTAWGQTEAIRKRAIPASVEQIPVIGMGSWLTFNIGDTPQERAERLQVLQHFFARGGRRIDSSPMYGSAEEVLGDLLGEMAGSRQLFAATKVWTLGRWAGVKQMENSQRLWGVPRFDLMQVHNLLDWEDHLETFKAWKQEGRIRYVGVTTSHGRRHEELEQILMREKLDFVQFTYNVLDREAEERLLPLAAERGVAVIVNRPYRGGNLFGRVRDGTITVERSADAKVHARAERIANAGSDQAAKELLTRIEIKETVSADSVRLETRTPSGGLLSGHGEVNYVLQVPAGAGVSVDNVNGRVTLRDLGGRVRAETTNGGIEGRGPDSGWIGPVTGVDSGPRHMQFLSSVALQRTRRGDPCFVD